MMRRVIMDASVWVGGPAASPVRYSSKRSSEISSSSAPVMSKPDTIASLPALSRLGVGFFALDSAESSRSHRCGCRGRSAYCVAMT